MDEASDHGQDLNLVRSALSGDGAARSELAQRLLSIHRLLHARNRRLGTPLGPEDLLDLVQEVQLAIWRKLRTYEGRAALQTWIFRFCHIGMLKFLERRQRHTQRMQLLANEDLAESVPSRADGALEIGKGGDGIASEGFSRLLRFLAKREAEVARLRFLEQLSFEEIADVLGISISSAKTHCYRALEKLRSVVQQDADLGGEGGAS